MIKMINFKKIIFLSFIIFFSIFSFSFAETVKEIQVKGNERVSDKSIKMFSDIAIGDNIDNDDLNQILQNIYDTNFFNNVKVTFQNNILTIVVEESALVENVVIKGPKSKTLISDLKKNLKVKSRTSYNEVLFLEDKKKITETLKQKAMDIYKDALSSMEEGQYLIASEKFDQSESLLPQTEWAAKSALMSSYCLYTIGFYDEAILNLKRFKKVYPADSNIDYAEYLIAIMYYEQILDEQKDIEPLILSKKTIENFLKKYPNTDYALDLKFKLDLIINQMAAKEISIARYYIKNEKWIPAINRLKIIVEEYDRTIFVEEALYRLVEIYYRVGLENEAKAAAAMLGYNYNSSEWYEKSYKVLNKNYKPIKIQEKEENKLVNRIKKIFSIND